MKSHSNQEFGKKLEGLRVQALLTKKQFSLLIGFTRQTYDRWLKGQSPKPEHVEAVTKKILPLFSLMNTGVAEGVWPFERVLSYDPAAKFAALQEALEEQKADVN